MDGEARVRFELRSGETWRDPFATYAALRHHDPVHHVGPCRDAPDGFWVLSRHEDVTAAATDTATYSSAGGLTVGRAGPEQALVADFDPMVMQDPPRHTAFRRLVGRGFTPKQVSELEPDIRGFVVQRIEGLRAAGGGDVVARLLKPLPSMVVAHYLGVPKEDRGRFDSWTDAIVSATSRGDATQSAAAAAEMIDYFTALVGRRRERPGDDTVSQLVRAMGSGAPAEDPVVTVLQVLGFAFTMVTGGNDTTTGLLGGALVLLQEHPDQRRRLVDEPSLVRAAVEELLRLTSPVQGLARTVTRDIEVRGRGIPRGDKVLLLYAAANRDEEVYGDDAEQLVVDRRPQRILTFSHGAHHCLGAAAARLAARVTLEELLARCPGYVVDAAAGTYAEGGYVRRHESLPFLPG